MRNTKEATIPGSAMTRTAVKADLDWQKATWLSLVPPPKDSSALLWGDFDESVRSAVSRYVPTVEHIKLPKTPAAFEAESFDIVAVAPGQPVLLHLKEVHRVLKPNGTAVIYARNRYLGKAFIRSIVDSTAHGSAYSESEIRNGLVGSGFAVRFYWIRPGFETPHKLIPLKNSYVRAFIKQALEEPGRTPHRSDGIKSFLARIGVMKIMAPEFMAIAEKSDLGESALNKQLRDIGGIKNSSFDSWLFTHSRSKKNVILIFDTDRSKPALVVKTSTPTPDGTSLAAIESEFSFLKMMGDKLAVLSDPPFHVPSTLGKFRLGPILYTVESSVPGRQLAQRIFPLRGEERAHALRSRLKGCAKAAVFVARLLRNQQNIPLVKEDWWAVPPGVESRARGPACIERYKGWGQHGDFTMENIFRENGSEKLWLIDWEHAVRGVPPLFDFLSFVISALPFLGVNVPAEECFLDVFFGKGEWARFVGALIGDVCRQLEINEDQIWDMFLDFLVLRLSYTKWRNSPLAHQHFYLLNLAVVHKDDFLFK